MSQQIAVITTPTTTTSSISQSLSSAMSGRKVVSIGDREMIDQLVATGEVSVIISATDALDDLGIRYLEQLASSNPQVIRLLVAHEGLDGIPKYAPGAVNRVFPATASESDIAKAIENSERLRSLLKGDELTRRVSSIKSLPALPRVYQQLREELNKEEASAQKIAELIKSDVGITVKVLQIVNSAFYGLRSKVESPLQAVGMLGLDSVQNLVLAAGVFTEFSDPQIAGLSLESVYKNCLEVGGRTKHLTSVLGLDRREGDDAVMAGMLHAVGLVILMTEFKTELQQVATNSQVSGISIIEAQEQLLGVTHAELGAFLLSQWGFGDNVVEAVADHHRPSRVPKPVVNGLTAVHMAYALLADSAHEAGEQDVSALDMDYVNALGLSSQLPYLKRICMAMA